MSKECARCGRCCTSFGVCVTVFDILRIVKSSNGKFTPLDFVTLTPEPPTRERTEPAILINGKPHLLILKWKPNKGQECMFYDAKLGCLIYKSRPILCRTYPFKNEQKCLKNMKSRACSTLWMPVDSSSYLVDLETYEKELAAYQKIVDKWNKSNSDGTLREFIVFALKSIK